MWRTIGAGMERYRSYPRIVGETGGKDFIVAHASADPQALAVAVVRGGFEYQGQKCSAASRIYVPRSIWNDVRERIVAMIADVRMGDVCDFRNFMGAVIDRKAFETISGYLDDAKKNARVVAGGGARGERGYFIEPTLVETDDPGYRLLCEEIFGPVVTAHVYEDARWDETLRAVDATSPYALTGAIFANDRRAVRQAAAALRGAAGNFYVNDKPTGAVFADDRAAVRQAAAALRGAAGNFYVNDKPTGAVVGQQPFGGARASGTNDKAGSKLNLVRWVSARAVKETFNPPRDFRYPFMAEE
jgi:1-pyrroline-5-carboxylate dehydrogenase